MNWNFPHLYSMNPTSNNLPTGAKWPPVTVHAKECQPEQKKVKLISFNVMDLVLVDMMEIVGLRRAKAIL